MKVTSAHYKFIENLLPIQHRNLTISNLQVLMPFCTSPNKSANGVLDRVFGALQETDFINVQVKHVSLDSTVVKVHPDGTGALKKLVNNLSVNHGQDG